MNAIKLVLFDITGTILKDEGHMVRAVEMALRQNDIPLDEDDLREWRGAAKHEVIRQCVQRNIGRSVGPDDASVSRIYDDFTRMLEHEFDTRPAVAVPGADRTLEWIRERGIMIGATTGYHRTLSDILLRRAGWLDKFHTTVCSDEVVAGRPAPYMIFHAMETTRVLSVSEVMIVGDTPLDLQAGANAGVRGIVGVLTGIHGRERLEREPQTHILPSVAELPGVIREYERDR